MIIGVWQLAPGVKYAAVCERIENTLARYDRFRQCAVQDATGASWVADRSFDLAHHVVREKLPGSASGDEQRALQDRVAELASQPLDRARPLWRFHLIEDYTGPDGVRGSAMIVRIHHCIADGIALIGVTMSLVDGGAPPARTGATAHDAVPQDAQAGWSTRCSSPSPHLTVKALDALGDGAARSLGRLNPAGQGPGWSKASRQA